MARLKPDRLIGALFVGLLAAALTGGAARGGPDIGAPATVTVPAGPFIFGSDPAEREAAYRLDEGAYGHSRTRQGRWYESERPRTRIHGPAFAITATPITNAEYAHFVAATGHPAPGVDAKTWAGYGLIHPFARTRRHAWPGNLPQAERADHPVVLVSHEDAWPTPIGSANGRDGSGGCPAKRNGRRRRAAAAGDDFPGGTTSMQRA